MPVNARTFVRKMRGGAQAHLLQADDDRFYVVKFQNNPQHPRILVNEVIATEILHQLQIDAPQLSFINLTPKFLADHPEVHMQLGSQKVPVKPGWHFGSRFPGDPNLLTVYDFIPDSMFPQVANIEQFLGVLVFDKWVANADGRQSIFFRAKLDDWLSKPGIPPRKMGFIAHMIDHGYAFNGPNWTLPDSPLAGLYSRRCVYEGVSSIDQFQPWLDRVRMFPEAAIDRAISHIPPEWIGNDEPELLRLMEALLRRRDRIADLILLSRKAACNPFPLWR